MQILRKLLPRACMVIVVAALSLPAFAEVVDVDSATLQKLMDQGVTLVDVRRAEEWQETGVIENSHLITFFDSQGEYDAEKWLSELNAIVAREEPVALICHSGARSKLISKWLSEKQGFSMVYNVANGISSWEKDGGASHPPGSTGLK